VNRLSSRPFWSLVGLLVAYYAFPIRLGHPLAMAASLIVTAAGLGLLVAMMVQELHHLRHGEKTRAMRVLILVLVLLVMLFSLAFFLLDLIDPGQISELDTRTDALYFTLSTMATVGYGDIHAEGQLARVVVGALIAFDAVVVASLVREYSSRRDTSG
jgi:voltage-gated potassium channel